MGKINKTTAFILISLLLLVSSSSYGREEKKTHFRPKLINSITATSTGQRLRTIQGLYIDEEAGELYIVDGGNGRVVITTLSGTPLYSFRVAKEHRSLYSIAVDKKGRILLAGGQKIAIYDYKGVFIGEIDLSGIPDKEEMNLGIQSIAVDEAGHIYLGSAGIESRIIELDSDGTFMNQVKGGKNFVNVNGLQVGDEFTLLDSAYFRVLRINRAGEVTLLFGTISSILGGFSMPSYLAIDKKKEWIIVVDTNRGMVIVFDKKGQPVFEFGGQTTFKWPRIVVTDRVGHIYVADGSDSVRVFEVIEEGKDVPPPSPAPAPVARTAPEFSPLPVPKVEPLLLPAPPPSLILAYVQPPVPAPASTLAIVFGPALGTATVPAFAPPLVLASAPSLVPTPASDFALQLVLGTGTASLSLPPPAPAPVPGGAPAPSHALAPAPAVETAPSSTIVPASAPGTAPSPLIAPAPLEGCAEIVTKEGSLLPVFFDFDSYALTGPSKAALDKNAQWLRENPNANIEIRGYADMRGTDKYNFILSKKRAKAVKGYLKRRGIKPKRMTVAAKGRQTLNNGTKECLKLSRRSDILVK